MVSPDEINNGYTAFHNIAEKCVLDNATFLLQNAAENLLCNDYSLTFIESFNLFSLFL